MLVEPQLGGDFVSLRVLVIVVGCAGDAPILRLDLSQRCLKVVDPAMKIVGGAEEDNGARESAQVLVVTDRGAKQRVLVVAITDSATGRCGRLDAIVGSGGKHGEFASHRMPVDTQSPGVDLRLPDSQHRLHCDHRSYPFRGEYFEKQCVLHPAVQNVGSLDTALYSRNT